MFICFSPYERTCVSVLSKGREEIFLTQFSYFLWRFLSLIRWSRVSISSVLIRYCSVVFIARWSAMSGITSSKLVGISCLSLSSRCCSLMLQWLSLLHVTVINPRSDQSSARGFDDLDSLLCVQRRLQSLQRWLNPSCCRIRPTLLA